MLNARPDPDFPKLAKKSWPGAVTLVFPAKQILHKACYQKGYVAIRVDGDAETRRMAKSCGGLMVASSLNRKGKAVQPLILQTKYRWHRHLAAVIPSQQQPLGTASKLFKVTRHKVKQLR